MPDPSEGASPEAQGARNERRGPRWRLVAVVAVLALSANLRPVATAVGPVLEEIRADLGLGLPTRRYAAPPHRSFRLLALSAARISAMTPRTPATTQTRKTCSTHRCAPGGSAPGMP